MILSSLKGHIYKVIVAMLITDIHQCCLWNLAPAWTNVKLRLERMAAESSCPNELDMYNDGWLVSMLYNIFYSFIHNFPISNE